MRDNENNSPVIAGLHVAGPNSGKTAMVMLAGLPLVEPLRLVAVHGRIGNYGRHLSDERLIELLRPQMPVSRIVVDVPLTVPPCVTCTRPVCPGVSSCDDVSVNFMLSLAERSHPRRQRRSRPINPQSQRLWDMLHLVNHPERTIEPTYNSNVAPLVTRARTFRRRLNHEFPELRINETNVGLSLQVLAEEFDLPFEWAREFRSFSAGGSVRRQWLAALQSIRMLGHHTAEQLTPVAESVEAFQAFAGALVGALAMAGLVAHAPEDYDEELGWVQVPEMRVDLDLG
jgi:hypothetical protein